MDGFDGGGHGGHMGELHHGHSHDGLSGQMDNDGTGGRKVGLSPKGASITMVCSHHDLGFHDRFTVPVEPSVEAPKSSVPASSPTKVDAVKDTVTLEEAERTGKKPTRVYWAYAINHGYYDHTASLQNWSRELSERFMRGNSPVIKGGQGWFGKLQTFGLKLLHMIDPRRRALIRVDTRLPGISGSDEKKNKLLSYLSQKEDATPDEMPDGYLPGFTGETRMIRHVYQIGRWSHKERCYVADRDCETMIEVTFIVWKFEQTQTWTTRFTVNVASRSQYNLANGQYGFVRRAFEEHQLLAQWLAKHLVDDLANAKPTPTQLRLLETFAGSAPRPLPRHEPGHGPAPDDIAKELEEAGLERANRTDKDPRRDGGKPGSGGVGYLDSPGEVGTHNDPDAPAPEALVSSDAAASETKTVPASGADLSSVLPGNCTDNQPNPGPDNSREALYQPKVFKVTKVPVKK